MAVTLRNEITAVETVLMDILQLAFWRRLPPLATLAALKARSINTVVDGALLYVVAENRLYRYIEFSTTADDALNVIQPSTLPPGQLKGRWHRVSSAITYGPDSNAPLQSRQGAVCHGVLLYRGDETHEDFVEQVYGHEPSMFLKWTGDAPEPKSAGFRGSLYRNEHSFILFIGSQCLRRSPAAVWGSPLPPEAAEDPGINALIGEARFVLAGVETYVEGIEFVEFGNAYEVHENLDERIFVYALSLRVRVSHCNDDLDLIPLLLEVQPKWSGDAAGATGFDPENYVKSGLELDLGPGGGLAQTVVAGVAVLAGFEVMAAATAHTFTADRDTYRDLKPDGSLVFTEVDVDAEAPPLLVGALRLAVTRTDGADVLADFWLAAFSIDLEQPYTLP